MGIGFLVKAVIFGISVAFLIGCATTTTIPKGNVAKAYDLYNGLKVKNDYKQALDISSKSCFSQDSDSSYGCFLAGWEYYKGIGVGKDYKKAFTYFNEGCKNKKKSVKTEREDLNGNNTRIVALPFSQKSCYFLGKLYEKGLGVEKDYVKAYHFYEKGFGEKPEKVTIFKFPDFNKFMSKKEIAYSIKETAIENSWYVSTPMNVQEQDDMNFFVFNDYILTLKEQSLNGEVLSPENPFYQIEKIYKNSKESKNKDIEEKKKESFATQKGNLFYLKFDPNNPYALFLPAVIKKIKNLDINKALAFYDFLLELDKKLPKSKNQKSDEVLIGEKILIYAYDDLERMSYMNKGVLNEMLYVNSKNVDYFRQATLNYGKACDSKYVLACAFYKNIVDGLSNIPKE